MSVRERRAMCIRPATEQQDEPTEIDTFNGEDYHDVRMILT